MLKIYRYNDEAFSIFNLLSEKECQEWIEKAENIGFTNAPVSTTKGDELNSAVRNNSRVIIDDSTWSEVLWERIKKYVPKKIGAWKADSVNDKFRIYRYQKHQQFKKHSDGAISKR